MNRKLVIINGTMGVKDIELGLRDESCKQKSLGRINKYNKMQTQKLDTSELSIEQAVERIIYIIN